MLLRSASQPRRGPRTTAQPTSGSTATTVSVNPSVSHAAASTQRAAGLASYPPRRSLHPLRARGLHLAVSASEPAAAAAAIPGTGAGLPSHLALALATSSVAPTSVAATTQRTTATLSAVPTALTSQATAATLESATHAFNPANSRHDKLAHDLLQH